MCERPRRECARIRREIQLLLSQMIVRGRELEIKLVLLVVILLEKGEGREKERRGWGGRKGWGEGGEGERGGGGRPGPRRAATDAAMWPKNAPCAYRFIS